MITVTVKLVQPSSIVELRRWGDPVLTILDGMSTAGLGFGSFQEIPMAHRLRDNPANIEFGAITNFQEFGKVNGVIPELEYLKAIQPNDFEKWGYALNQKIGWLIGDYNVRPPQQIYWAEGGNWNEPACVGIKFGTLGFGGQKLAVEVDVGGVKKIYRLWGKYRGEGIYKWIDFYKVLGFRRTDMGRPINELLAEGKVQICTSANRSATEEDVYTETLKGVVYSPIWNPYDWNTNTGNELFIAKEFCK